MEKEKLALTKEQAQELIYGDIEDFKVIEDKQTGNSRWAIHHRIVIQRESDGKYFADKYSKAATESQDEQPFQYNEPDFTQVFPVEKTITVYE